MFGQGDLTINFDDVSKSSSKLGKIYRLPENSNSNILTGSQSDEFGHELIEIEVY